MNEICKECKGACCKVLIFKSDNSRTTQIFYTVRDCKNVNGNVFVPYKCPQLDESGRCLNYETRPLACKIFRVGGEICKACQKVMK